MPQLAFHVIKHPSGNQAAKSIGYKVPAVENGCSQAEFLAFIPATMEFLEHKGAKDISVTYHFESRNKAPGKNAATMTS
jgi:hypothetical protein